MFVENNVQLSKLRNSAVSKHSHDINTVWIVGDEWLINQSLNQRYLKTLYRWLAQSMIRASARNIHRNARMVYGHFWPKTLWTQDISALVPKCLVQKIVTLRHQCRYVLDTSALILGFYEKSAYVSFITFR